MLEPIPVAFGLRALRATAVLLDVHRTEPSPGVRNPNLWSAEPATGGAQETPQGQRYAHREWASSETGPRLRQLFCSETRVRAGVTRLGQDRGPYSATTSSSASHSRGLWARSMQSTLESPARLTSPSSCTGRWSTARSRLPAAVAAAAAAAAAAAGAGRAQGPGTEATAAPRACEPPTPHPACSGRVCVRRAPAPT